MVQLVGMDEDYIGLLAAHLSFINTHSRDIISAVSQVRTASPC